MQGIIENLNRSIDHTALSPLLRPMDIEKLCVEAVKHDFYSVCIPPAYVPLAQSFLGHKKPEVVTVVGFPFGYGPSPVKAAETIWCCSQGAAEVDMVMSLPAAKEGDWGLIENDIHRVVQAAQGKRVKVIIETDYLSNDEKTKAAETIVKAGAHFVKTSTGFANKKFCEKEPQGATPEDIQLLKDCVGDDIEIKASGGIKTREQAVALIQAGATRLGTSAGLDLIQT